MYVKMPNSFNITINYDTDTCSFSEPDGKYRFPK
jgi:hypothetical protein